jgi:hypothetical protein
MSVDKRRFWTPPSRTRLSASAHYMVTPVAYIEGLVEDCSISNTSQDFKIVFLPQSTQIAMDFNSLLRQHLEGSTQRGSYYQLLP